MLPSLLVAIAAWASPSVASTSTCILSNLDSSSPVCANLPPALSGRKAPAGDKYLIGVGKADITGPVVELSLAGYGKFDQNGSGLRQRLYSRAFIVASRSNPKDRIAYLVLDDLAGDTAVRYGVLDAMAALGGEYAAYYNAHSVALTATHTHSGPGGWFNYLLPQAPTLGLDLQSYKAIVDGAALSIQRAHDSLEEGYLDLATVEVPDAAINRSPSAYLMNPKDEREKYETSVDTTMTVLRFQRARDSKSIGLLNWFPVHGTSIYNNNTHVAGDNKGVAAWLVEQAMKADDSAAEGFVAGFSQGNEGDASPNTEGAWCEDGSNARCDMGTSACADGYSEKCKARGPEFRTNDAGVKSCYEIGRRQYAGAKKAYVSTLYKLQAHLNTQQKTLTLNAGRHRIRQGHAHPRPCRRLPLLPRHVAIQLHPPRRHSRTHMRRWSGLLNRRWHHRRRRPRRLRPVDHHLQQAAPERLGLLLQDGRLCFSGPARVPCSQARAA